MEGTFCYHYLFDITGIFIGILWYFGKYINTGQLGDNGNTHDLQLPIFCILHFSMNNSPKPIKIPGIE